MDKQQTGMAGEFLVAGKLFKRGYQVAITLGNAKAVDLFVHNPNNPDPQKVFRVQVKKKKKKSSFDMNKKSVKDTDICIFVVLNGDAEQEEYFIVRGQTILDDPDKFFGTSYTRVPPSIRPTINIGPLKEFKNKWEYFDI